MKTIIEAGHYYAANGPSELSMAGWQVGKQLAVQQDGTLVLFVDDYHQEQEFLEPGDEFIGLEDASDVIKCLEAEADHVFYEAALAELAPQKITHLLDDGLVKLKKGVVSAAGVRLGCLRRRFNSFTGSNMRLAGFFTT